MFISLLGAGTYPIGMGIDPYYLILILQIGRAHV